jgi:hypothetical protein
MKILADYNRKGGVGKTAAARPGRPPVNREAKAAQPPTAGRATVGSRESRSETRPTPSSLWMNRSRWGAPRPRGR